MTNPANPTTTATLQDAMRSALGREGRSWWLADGELSVRSALQGAGARKDRDALCERACRALHDADEEMSKRHGWHRGARTAPVAGSLLELRAGRVLSAANEQLLKTALTALSDAGAHHQTPHESVSAVLDNASGDGTSDGTPPGSGNPIMPQDGAGLRSAALKLQRAREAELRRMGIVPSVRRSPKQLRRSVQSS